MKILISGGSGFIGSELIPFLQTCGHKIIRLVRDKADVGEEQIFWDPVHGVIDEAAFEGVDAVINLSGENISGGRWSQARKERILQSRVEATKTLATAMSKLKRPPGIFISGSAIGYYGDRGDAWCTEDTPQGNGFLAKVCADWEDAAAPAIAKGIRTVFLRTGIVLSPNGGALKRMIIPFKTGFGGAFGSGHQYMSWVAIDDLVAIILFALTNSSVQGPINAVAPNPVTNNDFTQILCKVLKRPKFFNTPTFMLRLVFGKEMADQFLLASTRVEPFKLTQEGYSFDYPELETALKSLVI